MKTKQTPFSGRISASQRFAVTGVLAACCFMAAVPPTAAQATGSGCGDPFTNTYGPFDYRVDRGPKLKIVEDYHFTPNIELLIRGNSGPVGGELAYTLRAFPNHHRALVALMKLGVKEKTSTPAGANFSVECYLLRAIQFRHDDTVARMLLARFFTDNKRKDDAIKQLAHTAQYAKDNGFTHYNIGLSYFELKEYSSALIHAHRALDLGFERSQLKEKLQTGGHWRDAAPEPQPPAPAALEAAPNAAAASGASQ